LPKFGKVPKGQSNILHPKMSQIARNFSATFCATSATSLAQLLDLLDLFGSFERNFLGGLCSG